MRVLVLGGNGFIGQHVVHGLLAAGHSVRIYERRAGPPLPPAVEVRHGLLEDRPSLAESARGMDAVVYLSWTGYPGTFKADFALDIHANLFTAISVMETCRLLGTPRLVFASSGGTVYGIPQTVPIPESHPTQPIAAHGLGKLMAEQYLAVYRHRGQLSSIVLRTSNAFGPGQRPERGQGLVATLLGRMAQGRPVQVWGDGSAVRDYVFVTDVAAAFVRAVEYSGPQSVFNVGSGRGVSVRDLVATAARVTGRTPDVALGVQRPDDVPVNVLDAGLALRELGWRPRVTLEEGLGRTWPWIQRDWLCPERT